MILNQVEFAMMNNPVRAWIQRNVEATRMLRMGGAIRGGQALEIGCGRGIGVEIILDKFAAGAVDAFDLDGRMVALASRRLKNREQVRLWVGDCTAIPVKDATYDAVFNFGIIHHVPDWRAALREVARVLKPGGRFYAEEVLDRFITHPMARQFLDHPQSDRFGARAFQRGMQEFGLELNGAETLGEVFAWFLAVKP